MPAASDQTDVILLFGGDGTVHRHLGQLVKLGVPVLIVPVGSGNDFARALGFRRVRDSRTAWRQFCSGHGNVRAIDLGVVAPLTIAGEAPVLCYFASVAGVGLDGEVARRANALPRWLRGHGGYALALLPAIFGFAPVQIKLSMRDEDAGWIMRSDQPTILAAFANTSSYGGGMKIAPRAQFDDGQLDICVIRGIHPFKLASLCPTVYFGRHLEVRGVTYYKAEKVRVETETARDVYADGEYVCRTPVEVSIEPEALKVITL